MEAEPSNEVEKLEQNLDDLYLGATTRHQWQVLVSTIESSKKEHREKQAKDRAEGKEKSKLKKRKGKKRKEDLVRIASFFVISIRVHDHEISVLLRGGIYIKTGF